LLPLQVCWVTANSASNTVAYNTSKAAIILTRAPQGEAPTHKRYLPWLLPYHKVLREGDRVDHEGTPLVVGIGGEEDINKGLAVFFASEASRHVTGRYLQ
jgi:gluconate 5-dehydrogenase